LASGRSQPWTSEFKSRKRGGAPSAALFFAPRAYLPGADLSGEAPSDRPWLMGLGSPAQQPLQKRSWTDWT